MREHDEYLSRCGRGEGQSHRSAAVESQCQEPDSWNSVVPREGKMHCVGSDTLAEKGSLAQSIQRHEIIQSRPGLGKALWIP